MIYKRYITSFVLALSFLTLLSCKSSPEISPLPQHLEAGGYAMYYPARSNWGPGTVLIGKIVDNKLIDVQEICSSLYSNLEPVENSIALASYKAKQSADLKLGIDLLGKILGPDKTANLGLTGEDISNIEVSFGPSVEDSISGDDAFQNDKKPRRIKPSCEGKLKDLKEKGQLDHRVFVITRAIRSGIKYEFNKSTEFDANATLSVTKKIGAQAGTGWSTDGKTGLNIHADAGLYLGAARGGMLALSSWLPSGTISDGYYITNFEPVSVDSIKLK